MFDHIARYPDILGEVLSHLGEREKASFACVNSELCQATRRTEETRAYQRLVEMLCVLRENSALPDDQKTVVRNSSLLVQHRIDNLSTGSDPVSRQECIRRVEEIRRVLAVALSQGSRDLPVPQNGDPTREVLEAASAYSAILEYITREGSFGPIDLRDSDTVTGKCACLPGHYLQYVSHLLGRWHISPVGSMRSIRLLCSIHKILCKRGDLNMASFVYRQGKYIFENAPDTSLTYIAFMLNEMEQTSKRALGSDDTI